MTKRNKEFYRQVFDEIFNSDCMDTLVAERIREALKYHETYLHETLANGAPTHAIYSHDFQTEVHELKKMIKSLKRVLRYFSVGDYDGE